MTPDELTAAIRNIPCVHPRNSRDLHFAGGHRAALRAAAELVTEHLAAEPDASPAITREWLVSKGGREAGDWIAFGGNDEPRITLALSRVHHPGEWLCIVNGGRIKPLKTQAEFLRLAACLGVGLKEGQS